MSSQSINPLSQAMMSLPPCKDRIRPLTIMMAAAPSTNNDGTLDRRAFVAGLRRFATSAQVCVD